MSRVGNENMTKWELKSSRRPAILVKVFNETFRLKHFTSNFMINRSYRLGFLRLPTYILMKFVTQSFAVTSEINAALQSLANEHV